MWKLYFESTDGGKCVITGKGKEATPEQLRRYTRQYSNMDSAIYQEYPKKDNEPIKLW